jgi:hypothetical protein
MRRIREQPVPRTGREDVPASLERLLAQAMAKNPLDRPKTALQLARALQTIEAEQRWALTPLVLLAEENEAGDDRFRPGNPTVDGGKDPATFRRPHSVVAQPAQTVAGAAAAAPTSTALSRTRIGISTDDEPATMRKVTVNGAAPEVAPGRGRPERVRQRMPTVPDEVATIRRPKVATAEADNARTDKPVSAVETSSKVWKLAVASAVLVVIAAGTAFALSGHGVKTRSATTIPPGGPAPTLVPPRLSPDSPTVTGSRPDPSHVKFTWSMASSQPGDVFYWKPAGGTAQAATGNSVTLPASDSQRPCIIVEVVRGSAYADSTLSCG